MQAEEFKTITDPVLLHLWTSVPFSKYELPVRLIHNNTKSITLCGQYTE